MRWGPLLVLLAVLSTGCVTTGYRNAVGGFATATVAAADAVSTSLAQADVQAREAAVFDGYGEFEDPAALQAPTIADLNAKSRLTDDQRTIRRSALSTLKSYGNLLKQLAESEAPSDVAAASAKLSTQAGELQQTLSSLGGGDGAFGALMQPVSSLFGQVLKAVLATAIRQALDDAILGGEVAIGVFAEAMEKDLIALHQDRKAYLSGRRSMLQIALQQTVERAKDDPGYNLAVIELTERVVAADDALRLWSVLTPEAAPRALAKAHEKLREYAEGGHKKELLTEAGTAVYELAEATYQLVDTLLATAPAGAAALEDSP